MALYYNCPLLQRTTDFGQIVNREAIDLLNENARFLAGNPETGKQKEESGRLPDNLGFPPQIITSILATGLRFSKTIIQKNKFLDQISTFGNTSDSICNPNTSALNWLYSPTTASTSRIPSASNPSRCTAARCELIQ
jgi:hypothetical protein